MTEELEEPKHRKIAKRAEDISMVAGITSTFVSIGASLVEPKGLSAMAVFFGFSDPPLLITLAPIVTNVATAIAVISGGCFAYSKLKG